VAPLGPTARVKRRFRAEFARLEWKLDRWILNRRYGFPDEAAGIVWLADLGLDADDRNSYSPSSWGVLKRILSPSEVSPEDVFIDIGSGMGRVVFEAARYPSHRVIGVEVAPQLTEAARTGIERNRHRLACQNVELVSADAVEYEIPGDVTVAYFANPFEGETFKAVIGNLLDSLDRNPRRLRLVYVEPSQSEYLERTGRFRFVRNWRRGFRVWEPRGYVSLYEALPPPG
jgi:SAM-dependent methyltransferase